MIITPLLDDWSDDNENMTAEERCTRHCQCYKGDMNICRACSNHLNNQTIQLLTLHSISLQSEVVAFQQETYRKFNIVMQHLLKVNCNLSCLLQQPFHVVGSSGSSNHGRQRQQQQQQPNSIAGQMVNQVVGMNVHVNLSNHPRSMILLWREWEFGISNNKLIWEFTARLGLETNGLKGTHSVHKKAATDARENGCSKDDIDMCFC